MKQLATEIHRRILESKGFRLAVFCIGFILLWQVVSLAGIWPQYIFPQPAPVFATMLDGVMSGVYVEAILASLKRMAIGFGASLLIGGIIGLLLSQMKFLEDTLGQLVLGLQALPSICWLPLAIVWFGLNDKGIVFVVIMGAVCSVAIAVNGGIRNVQPLFINAARTMGAKEWALYTEVIFPAALPAIISGIRQGWSFAWRSLMAGELIFFTAGLGQLLQAGRELNDTSQIMAVMFVIMLLGVIIEKIIFAGIEHDIRRKWGLDAANK